MVRKRSTTEDHQKINHFLKTKYQEEIVEICGNFRIEVLNYRDDEETKVDLGQNRQEKKKRR